MNIIDEKTIMLNNGTEDMKIQVYLKEVVVKNKGISTKAFCKIIKD